mmetsp:Transcript_33314/g.81747  ORF Transcript_33314/g.81747 Transcript_33314/m.81747 type:complete len:545 (-) Transcript_33314:11-1645(-)
MSAHRSMYSAVALPRRRRSPRWRGWRGPRGVTASARLARLCVLLAALCGFFACLASQDALFAVLEVQPGQRGHAPPCVQHEQAAVVRRTAGGTHAYTTSLAYTLDEQRDFEIVDELTRTYTAEQLRDVRVLARDALDFARQSVDTAYPPLYDALGVRVGVRVPWYVRRSCSIAFGAHQCDVVRHGRAYHDGIRRALLATNSDTVYATIARTLASVARYCRRRQRPQRRAPSAYGLHVEGPRPCVLALAGDSTMLQLFSAMVCDALRSRLHRVPLDAAPCAPPPHADVVWHQRAHLLCVKVPLAGHRDSDGKANRFDDDDDDEAVVQVVYSGGGVPTDADTWLQQAVCAPRADVLLANFGFHVANATTYTALLKRVSAALVARDGTPAVLHEVCNTTTIQRPLLVWRDTVQRHFDARDGEYHGGAETRSVCNYSDSAIQHRTWYVPTARHALLGGAADSGYNNTPVRAVPAFGAAGAALNTKLPYIHPDLACKLNVYELRYFALHNKQYNCTPRADCLHTCWSPHLHRPLFADVARVVDNASDYL